MKLAALAAVALVGTTLAVAPTQEAKACGPACVVGAAILGTFALATVATAATYPGYYGYGRGYYPGSYPGYYGYYGAGYYGGPVVAYGGRPFYHRGPFFGHGPFVRARFGHPGFRHRHF
jgi:hypothetical protein